MSLVTIPTIGSVITLLEDWAFELHPERRNHAFWKMNVGTPVPSVPFIKTFNAKGKHSGWRDKTEDAAITYCLPKGTQLKVDRLYIRQNAKLFDSITFRVLKSTGVKLGAMKFGTHAGGRFWAKLEDVNKINGSWDATTIP
jgi:hypothetical protein